MLYELNENIKKTDDELDNLAAQKRNLEEKEQSFLDWKKQDTAYMEQLCGELHRKGSFEDTRLVESMLNDTQQLSRQKKQLFEQERENIMRNRKLLEEQKETYIYDYRQKLSKEETENGAKK